MKLSSSLSAKILLPLLILVRMFTGFSAAAQPTPVSRPTALPLFTNMVTLLTTNTAAVVAPNMLPSLAVAIYPYHNVSFQFDLGTTNAGTSNLLFGIDTTLDGNSWKSQSHTLTQALTGTATNTVILTLSNVPALYLRVSSLGNGQTNTVTVQNPIYYPFL